VEGRRLWRTACEPPNGGRVAQVPRRFKRGSERESHCRGFEANGLPLAQRRRGEYPLLFSHHFDGGVIRATIVLKVGATGR
jgi:hypothetical protein